MAKKQKHEEPVTELEPVVEAQIAADDAEIEEQIALPNSVVKREYKVKYRDRARANGLTSKAAKRSAWTGSRKSWQRPRSRRRTSCGSTISSPYSTRTESTTAAGRTGRRAGKDGSG